jgi:hypothetical protein
MKNAAGGGWTLHVFESRFYLFGGLEHFSIYWE